MFRADKTRRSGGSGGDEAPPAPAPAAALEGKGGEDGYCVTIHNLSYDTKRYDLKEHVKSVLVKSVLDGGLGGFGRVELQMKPDGTSTGRARIRFRFLKDAEAAAKKLHDTELDGRTLSARLAPPRRERSAGKGAPTPAPSAATPAPTPEAPPAPAPAPMPTTRDGVVDALATWIGGLPHPRARSTDVDRWLAWHRARSDVVPEGLDWLTVGQLAPHGLRKRRATEGFFWIEVTASASAPAPAPSL